MKQNKEPIFYASENPNPIIRLSLEGELIYHNEPAAEIVRYWTLTKSKILPEHVLLNIEKAQKEEDVIDDEITIKDKTYLLRFSVNLEKGYVNVFGFDISIRKKYQKEVIRLSKYDTITNLPNREYFSEVLNNTISYNEKHNLLGTLILLQINDLKYLSSLYDEKFVNKLIADVSKRIVQVVPRHYFLARMSNSVLAIVRDEEGDLDDAATFSQVVIDNMAEPFFIDEHEIEISTCVGVTTFPDMDKTASDIIRNANIALEVSIKEGKNTYHLFHPYMASSATARHNLSNDLKYAIEKNQLRLYYQPQIELKNETIVGAEALVRWMHPKFGLLTPLRFTKIAEERGMMSHIGNWVLKEACNQAKFWHEQDGENLTIAVNLSASEIKDVDLVDRVSRILKETGLDAKYLELEMLENELFDNIDKTIQVFEAIRALGVKVSIDDFGTGYSSLSYLQKLPVDKIKIDRSFIANLEQKKEVDAIVDSIIHLGHKLNMVVLAEGIENRNQIEILSGHNCDLLQGFYYSEPVNSEKFQELLISQNTKLAWK